MAYYNDLREFLGVLEENGKLVRIRRPVVRETELMPLYRLQFRGRLLRGK
jgi:4-hydroxy-3-polyprenylbenzoate decarboxylase